MNVRAVRLGLLYLALAGLPGAAVAQPLASPAQVPASQAEINLSFAPVVQKTAPAVVNVYALKSLVQRNPFMDDPFFRRFFGGGFGGGPGLGGPERMQRSLGSGVIVDEAGFVVTNHHVVAGADQIRIALADRREFDADVVLSDQRTDLAVLKIKADDKARFPKVDLGNSDNLAVGDLVLAIGDPFGVGQTVTQGIVSALARTQVGISDYQFFIQTDAAINPGNSGGALVDMAGRLVGINTAIFSRSGGSHGIGFAIPANMVRVVVESARSGSKAVRRPWLGARLQRVTPEIAEGLGLSRPTGVLVQTVAASSPAEKAGLRVGDLIAAVDGQGIDDPESLNYRLATQPMGASVDLTVNRRGKDSQMTIVLAPPPETVPREEVLLRGRTPFAGIKAVNLSPAVAEELRVDTEGTGVAVIEVADNSPADASGFRPGDIIVDVNGTRVANTKDLDAATRGSARAWRVTVTRSGRTITAVLGG